MDAVVDPKTLEVVGYAPAGTQYGKCDHIGVPFDNTLFGKPLKVTQVDDVYTISLDEEALISKAWSDLRTERTRRLVESDWTQFTDSPLSPDQKTAWATYRQALRDLPASVTDPTNVMWPTPPS